MWTPRVSVGDDLERIHSSARTSDMSRDVGYLSVTMGEGAIEGRATDSDGDVRWLLGDQPDDRFGIGLWHRGGLKYLPDVLTDAEDRISATESKNDTQDHRLDAVTTLAEASRDRLDANDVKNGTQDHRLDALTTLGEESRDRLDANDTKNTTQDHRLDAVTTAVEQAASLAQDAMDAASGSASPTDVDSVRQAVLNLQANVKAWIASARQEDPSLPPWPGN